MWYLYTALGTRTRLQESDVEEDIALELDNWIQKDPNMWYFIVYYGEINSEPKTRLIRKNEDYLEYMKSYYKRAMQNKTCMELKKEMMDIVYDEPKPKVKKK